MHRHQIMALYRNVWQILCLLLVVFGVIVPCLLLLVTVKVDTDGAEAEQMLMRTFSTHERKPLDTLPDSREIGELRQQIRELEEIRASVRDELRVFEQQRTKLSSDIESQKETLVKVKKDVTTAKTELQTTRGKLSKANREFYDKFEPVAPPMANIAPVIILPPENKMASVSELAQSQPVAELQEDAEFSQCTFPRCFHYASCPLTQPFTVYVYNDANPYLFPLHHDTLVSDFVTKLKEAQSYTANPDTACVYVAIVENTASNTDSMRDIQTRIHSLSHWRGEGTNHLLIELATSRDGAGLLEDVRTGRALVAGNVLSPSKPFRSDYDILLPPLQTAAVSWQNLPATLPILRDNLIYFHGDYRSPRQPSYSSLSPADLKRLQQALNERENIDIQVQCLGDESSMLEYVREGEWALCGGQNSRLAHCSQSTFSLVPIPDGVGNGIGTATYTRLIESLMCGSIPVLIGIRTLPFDDIIDWTRAAITIPPGRFSDIHYILRSIDRDTITDYRLQGRNLWQMYFNSPLTVVQSVIAIVRYRALHPPPLASDFVGVALHSQAGGQRKSITSPVLTQNFTMYSQGFWNNPPGPFFTYPMTPFKPEPISGYQFTELDDRAMAHLPIHVLDGGGITGPNFEDLLLGNSREEQFTVVMLTYQRNRVLIEALARLADVSFLNKVVVVWNNEEDPPNDMEWPQIGVPIEVVRGKGNSLNNRFLPFKQIETEAVLSIDDDVHLRPDEIQFAFRVWREARDRIVGFPGRFHAYDLKHKRWMYNSNYTCELSMVLTGAAFYHKLYSYLYTYWQPREVREMVDHYMNCEDIAMNFLVSHVTRKPPLKVTSRWTFRCPGCPDTLSTDDTHFQERHVCMKFLTSLYGYMPLLYTQFRVDSVLFKTRLPSDLQKCYQFI